MWICMMNTIARMNCITAAFKHMSGGLYKQYESGPQTLRDYSLFTQHSTVIFHHEVFESQRDTELLSAPYF